MFEFLKRARGLHLDNHKSANDSTTISVMPPAKQLIIPLYVKGSHFLTPRVTVNETVRYGQIIAQSDDQQVKIPSPITGDVVAIEERAYVHASGLSCLSIILQSKSTPEELPLQPLADITEDSLKQRCIDAGIIGLGGAAFPAAKKHRRSLKTLLINGVECEPYISCDQSLMQHHAKEIISGIKIMQQAYDIPKAILAIEDDKELAIAAIKEQLANTDISLKVIKQLYPSGDLKQLIKQTLGISLQKQDHAADFGILGHNVATIYQIYRAVVLGDCFSHRIVTVAGNAVECAQNYMVRIGTPIQQLLEQLKIEHQHQQISIGGSMMATKVTDLNAPITASCQCILIQKTKAFAAEQACIRCGACYDVCPINLLPQQIYASVHGNNTLAIAAQKPEQCIECGCCDYVCPSHIPLVDYIRQAKDTLRQEYSTQKITQAAKLRHEARDARLIRREQELAEKRAARKREAQAKNQPPQAAIMAAVARAKAKKEQRDGNDENPTT